MKKPLFLLLLSVFPFLLTASASVPSSISLAQAAAHSRREYSVSNAQLGIENQHRVQAGVSSYNSCQKRIVCSVGSLLILTALGGVAWSIYYRENTTPIRTPPASNICYFSNNSPNNTNLDISGDWSIEMSGCQGGLTDEVFTSRYSCPLDKPDSNSFVSYIDSQLKKQYGEFNKLCIYISPHEAFCTPNNNVTLTMPSPACLSQHNNTTANALKRINRRVNTHSQNNKSHKSHR